jgi:hypothetical protein
MGTVSWPIGRESPAVAGLVSWSGEARRMPAKRKEIATAVNAVHRNFLFSQSILTFENMFRTSLTFEIGGAFQARPIYCFSLKIREQD